MFDISQNGIIEINRGDSFKVTLFVNQGTDIAPFRWSFDESNNSEIYFGLMEPNQPFERAILKKKFTKDTWQVDENDDLIIKIKSSDTECLMPGKYYYQIKARIPDEDGDYIINTLTPLTQFIILE